jgi:hypothetical protein
MKTMADYSKEISSGLVDIHKAHGFYELCAEMEKRYMQLRDEILTAWFAEHGFAPGKAVLVEDRSKLDAGRFFIREATEEELQSARAARTATIKACCEATRWFMDRMGVMQMACPICKTVQNRSMRAETQGS